MRLQTFEELECLLPNEVREKVRKEREMEQEEKRKQEATYPPFDFMRTQNRVLPLLPRWMRNKLVEAKNLHDHVNVICEGRTFWNHTITLPLDKWHDVTFAILDNYNSRREFRKTIKKVVEVYEDLQVLYRKYGHSLTIVSLQSKGIGLHLPSSFYCGDTTIEKELLQTMYKYWVNPKYGRELYMKWELGENIKHLKKLDTLRPLFDAIVEKTKDEEFAFGVKRRGAAVVPCDLVSYRSGNLCA